MNSKIIPIGLIITCSILISCVLTIGENNKSSETSICLQVPDIFQENDLIGTWKTVYGLEGLTDILVIKNDGTYDHEFINSNTGYHYESTGNKWRLEYKTTGEEYLHLKNMQFCGGSEETCIDPSTKMGFYDACESQWLTMDGEFILGVVGYKDVIKGDVIRGIGLKIFKPSGWEFYDQYYTLENPSEIK